MSHKKKLILSNLQSPGDIVMLTAAIRDLHLCYPNQFITDIRTPCPDLWEHNPYITSLEAGEDNVQEIYCHYPLIHESNTQPYHFIHGFIHYLNEQLNLEIKPTLFKGDIHITEEEKQLPSQVSTIIGNTPFWIINAGGKFDFTAKWWSTERYQKVIDYFKDKIIFVQVGEDGHHHPPLRGTIDLRGKTSLRELVLLTYHAQGVLTPVSLTMHLAAAVETKAEMPKNRACVVVAGGREPMHWEAYTHHQFIHTNGALKCCDNGGCWKSRVKKLHDGSENDHDYNLCVDVVNDLPRCLDMIDNQEVIRRIEFYYKGGSLNYIGENQGLRSLKEEMDNTPLNQYNAVNHIEAFITSIPDYPQERYKGKGIVMCGGGVEFFTCAWININMIRQVGCQLPIQLWYLGKEEMDDKMTALLNPLGVECVNAYEVRKKYPARILNGWEVKAYAVLHAPFEEVLFLDADNMPVISPDYLFDAPEYLQTGAVFWPDIGRFGQDHPIWNICGIPYQDEPEFESGQMLWNKRKTWKALNLSMWLNEHSDFFYRYIHGDKDTFHLAFRKLTIDYHIMEESKIGKFDDHTIFYQLDFHGNRLFQHRQKWSFLEERPTPSDYWFADRCRYFLAALRQQWNGVIHSPNGNYQDKLMTV